ncbi:MAG: hypothetical protein GY925_25995 [Actinomycetia bacterium]|nr:hypothetical protein [Actinomycetes bacterium]
MTESRNRLAGLLTLLAILAIVGGAALFYYLSLPEPSDEDLASILGQHEEAATRLVAAVVDLEGPVRLASGDFDDSLAGPAATLGVESILVRPDSVWLEFPTDTGLPWIALDEPTKSLVWADTSVLLPQTVETDTETFDYDVNGKSWVICRVLSTEWRICLDRR